MWIRRAGTSGVLVACVTACALFLILFGLVGRSDPAAGGSGITPLSELPETPLLVLVIAGGTKPLYYDDFRIDCGSAKLEIKGFLLLVVVAGCFFH
jgi:hypothetical protein